MVVQKKKIIDERERIKDESNVATFFFIFPANSQLKAQNWVVQKKSDMAMDLGGVFVGPHYFFLSQPNEGNKESGKLALSHNSFPNLFFVAN